MDQNKSSTFACMCTNWCIDIVKEHCSIHIWVGMKIWNINSNEIHGFHVHVKRTKKAKTIHPLKYIQNMYIDFLCRIKYMCSMCSMLSKERIFGAISRIGALIENNHSLNNKHILRFFRTWIYSVLSVLVRKRSIYLCIYILIFHSKAVFEKCWLAVSYRKQSNSTRIMLCNYRFIAIWMKIAESGCLECFQHCSLRYSHEYNCRILKIASPCEQYEHYDS